MRRLALALAGLTGFCLLAAGCDKCGEPVKINAPSFSSACHGTPQPKSHE
ncbi:MAG TPA: hypothetical protein VFF88_06590 [Methylocella sp.]|nr:hypothetical protein [Methylocella sp.]